MWYTMQIKTKAESTVQIRLTLSEANKLLIELEKLKITDLKEIPEFGMPITYTLLSKLEKLFSNQDLRFT